MPAFNWPVIGHQKIISYLQTVITKHQLNHAYLFYGPDGLGKSLVADYFIQSIFCLAKATLPCHSCVHCRQIKNQVHPDIIHLKREPDKKNISVEQIRQARGQLQRGTFLNSHKVIVIHQADTLSIGASNALLKILEEPLGKTVFIFLSRDLKNIPLTIISRMQLIKFLPVQHSEIEKHLLNQGVARQLAYELSRLSQGFPGKAISFLEHPKLLEDYKNNLKELLVQISGDLNSRFSLVEKLAGQTKSAATKNNAVEFLTNLNSLLRDILLIKNTCFDKVAHTWLKQPLSTLANQYSSMQIAELLHRIKLTTSYLEQNVNPRLALENLMLGFQ